MTPRIVSRHRRLPLPALVSVPFSRMELVTRDIVPLIDQLQRLLDLNSAAERIRRQGVLGRQVFVNALEAAFPSDARLFHSAEWSCRVRHDADVEAQHAGLQGLDEPLAAGQVLGVRVPNQAVLGVVGNPNGFLLIGEGDDAQHGPKDLFAENVAAGAYAGDNGWLVERAGSIDRMTAGQHLGPALGRVSYQRVGLLNGIVIDQRPDLDAVLSAPADLERLHGLGDPGSELVRDALVHDEPVRCGAGLTDVAEFSEHGTFDRLAKISIVEDQEGRVTAQLHGDAQDVGRRLLIELATYLGGPGEAQLP